MQGSFTHETTDRIIRALYVLIIIYELWHEVCSEFTISKPVWAPFYHILIVKMKYGNYTYITC